MILEADIDRTIATTPIVKLSGRMTMGTRLREVESQIDEVIHGGATRLILDVSAINYCDSTGLGLIMILYGKMKTVGGQLRIVDPNGFLLALFKTTCVDSILTVSPDVPSALSA
ncbi:MAG TPA: STAS domain-containing protein [Acidobacteriaceae bacterium]|jgi:anti-sigma B factor antagonist